MRPDFLIPYTSGNFSERVESIPLTRGSPYQRVVVMSIAVDDVEVGDVLECNALFQVTNNLGYNVMVAAGIILAGDQTETVGLEITEFSGRNVTPDMHHDTHSRSGIFVVTSLIYPVYINLVAYAASVKAVPGAAVRVDQDYGRLTVLRFTEARML